MKNKKLIDSFKYAFSGIATAFNSYNIWDTFKNIIK